MSHSAPSSLLYKASMGRRRRIGALLSATTICLFTAGYSFSGHAEAEKKIFMTGTGFFITHDGYALTAYHVVEHCKGDIGLYGTDMVIKARITARDVKHDLALVKIVPEMQINNITYFTPPEAEPKEEDSVIVAGYPRSSSEGVDFPVFRTNKGTVISTDKFQDANGETPLLFSNITEQGYSGGPVLDTAGNIIGMTLAGTCIGASCKKGFDAAMAQQASTPEADNSNELASNMDANMAVSLPFIRKFLADNNVAYSEASVEGGATTDRLTEISRAIVNVRCPSTVGTPLPLKGK